MKNILSIDGGGCLGCGPLRVLAQLEADGIFVRDDILAGTSVGGLLVLLRATGRSWMEIEQEFTKWVDKIFVKAPFWWSMDPTRPKFQDDGIVAATKALFGDLRCKDAGHPFFVTSFDFQQGRGKIWDNTDDALLRDVALRTSAAPTYFQPRDSRWADGALATNNPSVVALAGAMHKLDLRMEDISVMSFATGGSYWKDPEVGCRTTKLGWATAVIDACLEGGEELHEFMLDQFLGDRHFRLDPKCAKKFAMDDLSCMEEFKGIWQKFYDENKFRLINFVHTGRVK